VTSENCAKPEHRHFTCSICDTHCTADPDFTENDANAEYERTHGKPFNPDDASPVCDTCYTEVLAWARQRGLLLGGPGAN
jgi:hypothetical protein